MGSSLVIDNCMQCQCMCDPKNVLQWQDLYFCSVVCFKFYFEEEHKCAHCKVTIENFIRGLRLHSGVVDWYCSKDCIALACNENVICEFCLTKKKNCAYGIGCKPTLCTEKCQKSFNGFTGAKNLYYCGICHLAQYGYRWENILVGETTYHLRCWEKIDCQSTQCKCLTCKIIFYKTINGQIESESKKCFCSKECKSYFARESNEYVKCITCDTEMHASLVITNRNGMIWCSLECLTGDSRSTLAFQMGKTLEDTSSSDEFEKG